MARMHSDEEDKELAPANALLEHFVALWTRWPLRNEPENLVESILYERGVPEETKRFWAQNHAKVLSGTPPPGKCAHVAEALKGLDLVMKEMNEKCGEFRAKFEEFQATLARK